MRKFHIMAEDYFKSSIVNDVGWKYNYGTGVIEIPKHNVKRKRA